MTSARALAFAAAGAGVFGLWDLLAAAPRPVMASWLRGWLSPLARARDHGMEPSPGERRRLTALAAAALAAAGWLLAGPVAATGAATAAPLGVAAAVRRRRRHHEAALQAGAAGVARALAAHVAAGCSVRGAVEAAACDVGGAAGGALESAAQALALGVPTEAALEALRRSAAGGAWDTLVAALLLQRDAGGDLAGLLRGLAGALEEAARADADARAATAQARFTAGIVGMLPLAAAALAELGSPGFLAGLAGHPVSAALTALAVLLQVAAAICIRRLTR